MNTWTSKGGRDTATADEPRRVPPRERVRGAGRRPKRRRATTAALTFFTLAGCAEIPGGSFLAGLGDGRQRNMALSQATMAFGSVTLVPPPGFCIDRRTLRPQFALMARCDTLGVPSAAGTAPLGIIVASFTPATQGAPLPDPETTERALGLQAVSAALQTERSVTFRAVGDAGPAGTSADHWRATALVGDQLLGLALYGPKDGRALSDEGRSLLSAVIAAVEPAS